MRVLLYTLSALSLFLATLALWETTNNMFGAMLGVTVIGCLSIAWLAIEVSIALNKRS